MKWPKQLWSWFPYQPNPVMVKSDDEINESDIDTPFMYIFVRKDLPPVVKLIQVAHVTHNAGIKFNGVNNEKGIDNSITPIHFCVFGVKNETKLKSIAWDLKQTEFEFEMFYEPDFDIGNTAIAVEPIIGENRGWFEKFKLLKM